MVRYERILPTSARDHEPLFGTDSLTIGTSRWHRDGRRAERNAWDEAGQLEPIAMLGSDVIALAWSGFEIEDRALDGDNETWLVSGPPTTRKPRTVAATGLEFTDGTAGLIEVSPAHTAMVATEHEALVIRSLPEGKQLAHIPGAHHACWVDDHRIAWLADDKLTELDLVTSAREELAFAGTFVACDRAGGRAVIAIDHELAILDLATRTRLGAITTAYDHVAVAGRELAVLANGSVAVYRAEPNWMRTETVLATHAVLTHVAFSEDGAQLAVVGETLIVLQPGATATAQPALPVAEMPDGFATVDPTAELPGWSYAQLATPSGLAPLPALIVHAHRDFDEVVTLAIDRETLSTTLAPDADDVAIENFAKRVMPELFDSWDHAKIAADRDAEFTLRVGRRDGKPWFETRELWRDGCEPYDGYTQVVIDRNVIFVTRALVVPGETTNPWLQTFYDVPFGQPTKLARRRGPDSGPC